MACTFQKTLQVRINFISWLNFCPALHPRMIGRFTIYRESKFWKASLPTALEAVGPRRPFHLLVYHNFIFKNLSHLQKKHYRTCAYASHFLLIQILWCTSVILPRCVFEDKIRVQWNNTHLVIFLWLTIIQIQSLCKVLKHWQINAETGWNRHKYECTHRDLT